MLSPPLARHNWGVRRCSKLACILSPPVMRVQFFAKPGPHWNDLLPRTKVIKLSRWKLPLHVLKASHDTSKVICPSSPCPQLRPPAQPADLRSSRDRMSWQGVGVFPAQPPGNPWEGAEREGMCHFGACSISALSCLVRSRSHTGKDLVRNYKPLKAGACSHWKAENYVHAKKIAIYPSFSYLFCPLWQHQLQTTGFEFIAFGLQKVTALSA